MLTLVDQPATEPPPNNGVIDGRMKEDAQKKRQRFLSDMLQVVIGQIADALLKSTPVGQTVEIAAPGGPKVRMQKPDQNLLATKGARLGSFVLPPMADLFAAAGEDGRRMAECTEGVALQEKRWPTNVYGYAGPRGSARAAPRPDLPETVVPRLGVTATLQVEEDCCDILEDTVVSMEVRACGRTLEVQDLTERIRFDVPIVDMPQPEENIYVMRLCQYFNITAQAWTDEGCIVEATSPTSVTCACNHLSSFTAGFVTLATSFVEVVFCARVSVMTSEGFRQLQEGDWSAASVLLVLLMILFVVLAGVSSRWNYTWQQQCRLNRRQFFNLLGSQEPSDRKPQASLERMQNAAKKYDWLPSVGKAFWYVQWKLFNILVEPIEEEWMKSPLAGLCISLAVHCVRFAAMSKLGLAAADTSRLVVARNLDIFEFRMNSKTTSIASGYDGVDTLIDQYGDQLAQARAELAHGEIQTLTLWSLFKTHSPLLQAMKASVTMRRSIEVLALAMNIFGALAVSVVFLLQSEATFSLDSAHECAQGAFGSHVGRDIWVAVVSTVIAWLPSSAILLLHRRNVPYRHTKHERRAVLRKRLLEDVFYMIWGLTYLMLCVFFTMLVLSNLAGKDALHFLISAFFYLLAAWVVLPLSLALVWRALILVVMRTPRLKSGVGEVLEALSVRDRNLSKSDVYGTANGRSMHIDGSSATVRWAPQANENYERRAQKRFASTLRDTQVKDGRAPATFTSLEAPQWVHQWPLPPGRVEQPPPLVAWGEMMEQRTSPKAASPKVHPLALEGGSKPALEGGKPALEGGNPALEGGTPASKRGKPAYLSLTQ